jgi:hypothetical protein
MYSNNNLTYSLSLAISHIKRLKKGPKKIILNSFAAKTEDRRPPSLESVVIQYALWELAGSNDEERPKEAL